MVLLVCAVAAAAPGMVLADSQELPGGRLFMGGFAADPECKIVMTDLRGWKKSGGGWIHFYAKDTDGKTIKYGLKFDDGTVQVYALYDGGSHKGVLDRKYLLRENLPTYDKWSYHGTFSLEVADGRAVATLGNKSYTWPGVASLTGEMQVCDIGGKLEIYNFVRE